MTEELKKTAVSKLNLALTPGLPVSEAHAEIAAALAAHQVVIVAGETGSGKTTQLPKICLELGLGVSGLVGHTQPRRLAARTVSQRIAEEMGAIHGEEVGFSVRFTDAVSPRTLIKVMTDGILLNEIRRDPWLNAYDVVIVDEAHERSLNIDFLLGVLRRILAKRADFKVVVTSATIDVERFSNFFNKAPIIEVGGRTYPVEVEYHMPPEDLAEGIGDVLEDIETRPHQGASDVLIFLTGEREIFEVAKGLRQRFDARLEVLPLYARLSVAEQKKIFQAGGGKRRVVLATNVAETSITVPNIGFVIDPGNVRINRYSYRSKLQRLPVEPISQASANQRLGRCGRVAPGVCYRLYEESDYLSRPEYTDPEIRRVNLASVVLQMFAFRLGDIRKFPFIDPPEPRAIKDAMRLLEELQALSNGKITAVGRAMARLPLDPRLARMLVEANKLGTLKELLIIAAGLSVQDPRERPLQKTQAADQSHGEFSDPRSDFMAWLNLWGWLEEQRGELTNNRFRRLLQRKFIHPLRVREWREVHRQLRGVCRDLGFTLNSQTANYQAIHESILAGSLSLVAQHEEKGSYLGARNLKLRIFPGSGVDKQPSWIVAAEIAETARVYARNVARVDPAWVEAQAQHLVKRQFSEPHWSLKRGEVLARLNVSLYGLRLAENRLAGYRREDPDLCREIFIREGLVHGAIVRPPEFLRQNLALAAEIVELEAKGRRRDLLVSDDEILAFYDARIPRNISRVKDLEQWLKGRDSSDLLLSREVLLRSADTGISEGDFPSVLDVGGLSLELHYRFAPGEVDDGVSIDVPIGVLPGVSSELLEWTVPGFFALSLEQWLRCLPKAKRKNLAPLPDKVVELSEQMLKPELYRQGRLRSALALLLNDWYKLRVEELDWDRSRIAPHLLMNVRVFGEDGKLLLEGRDLQEIKAHFSAPRQSHATENQAESLSGLKALPDGKLTEYSLVGTKQTPVMKYPGLVDQTSHVDLVLFDDPAARAQSHRQGLARLVLLKLGKVGQYFRKELDKHPKLGLHYATLGSADELKAELLRNVVWYCFFDGRPLPTADADLEVQITSGRPQLATFFSRTVTVLDEVLQLRFECTKLIQKLESKAYDRSRADTLQHMQKLAPADLLSQATWDEFLLKPRYLKGLLRRLENLPGHVPQDLKRIEGLEPLEVSLQEMRNAELYDETKGSSLALLLEELRLVTFAEAIAKQKYPSHPLDKAAIGQPWKISAKKVAKEIRVERARLGLT